MSVAIVLAGIVHKLFDLASGQVFPDCTVYGGWWAGSPSLIRHRKFRAVEADWEHNTPFLYSYDRLVAPQWFMSGGISDLPTPQSSM